jgi:hypothetical protein
LVQSPFFLPILAIIILALATSPALNSGSDGSQEEDGGGAPVLDIEVSGEEPVEPRLDRQSLSAPAGSDSSAVEETESSTPDGARAGLEVLLPRLAERSENCLQKWWMREPGLGETVAIELEFDSMGLIVATVLDQTAVPDDVSSCLGEAAHGMHWPGVEPQLTMIVPVVVPGAMPNTAGVP